MEPDIKLLNDLLKKTLKECISENKDKSIYELYSLYDKIKDELETVTKTDTIKEKEKIVKEGKILKKSIHYKLALCKAIKKIIDDKKITKDELQTCIRDRVRCGEKYEGEWKNGNYLSYEVLIAI